MATLYDRAHGRDNNFNLLRMLAATAVLASHAYPIALGPGTAEPLASVLRMNLGTLAVVTFFVISGFFISQSFASRHSLTDFTAARVLRLYPGLLAVLLLTTFVLGPLCTSLSFVDYITDARTLAYVPRNLGLKWPQYDLPGVFRDNPYPETINGSLWSLFYEVACYGLVVVVGLTRLTTKSRAFLAFLAGYTLFYLAFRLHRLPDNHLVANICSLTLPFVAGMSLYQFRRAVPYHFIICVLTSAAAVVVYRTVWFPEVFLLAWAYLIFYVGYFPSRLLLIYNRVGDYSYGMYIYAFPCEQLTAAAWHGISPAVLTTVSFLATLACSVLSWHYLERRALAQRQTLKSWLLRPVRHPAE